MPPVFDSLPAVFISLSSHKILTTQKGAVDTTRHTMVINGAVQRDLGIMGLRPRANPLTQELIFISKVKGMSGRIFSQVLRLARFTVGV